MKKMLFICSFLSLSSVGFAQVGIGTTSPEAALDITSGNEGLLIPRVALTGTDDITTILTPKTSEMVYNTATAGAGITAVQPGYYYLSTDTGPWIRIDSGAASSSDWKITGNSDTNPTDNFLGTTNNEGLSIKTNNLERLRVTDAGNVGIGTANPAEKLHVEGNVFANMYSFKGHAGNSGVSLNNYGIYQEAGDWVHPYPDLNINYHTGIKMTGHYAYDGIRFYTGGSSNTNLAFQVGDANDWVVSYKPFMTSGAFMYPARTDVTGNPAQPNWWLGSHGSYGLYTNTGFYATSHIWTAGYFFGAYVNTTQPIEALGGYTANGFPMRTADNYTRMFSATDFRTALGLNNKPLFSGTGADAIALSTTGQTDNALELQAPVNKSVHIWFHRPGQWASSFGLDTDNQFAFGGWSNGNGYAGVKTGTLTAAGQVNATGQVLSGEWFRNSNGSMGLYNNALDNHFAAVTDNDWRITGSGSNCGLAFGANNFSTIYGYTYGDGSGIGFLSAARGWAIRNLDGLTQFSQNGPNDDGLLLSQSVDNTSSIQTYIDGQNSHAAIAAYAADANFILGLQPTKGFVGIGTLAPTSKLHVVGNATVSGTINSTGYKETSDRRWKKDIAPIANPLAKIMALKGVGYSFKTKQELSSQALDSTYNFSAKPQIGFIAQEVEAVLPEVVDTDSKGYKTIEYSKVVALLTEAVKEQQKQIEELKKQNVALKASSEKVDLLEAKLDRVEQLLKQRNNTVSSTEQ